MPDTKTAQRRVFDNAVIRRIKKPLIEKRRRDRINSSLSQLKVILLGLIKQNGGVQTYRLDKADILELTIRYLELTQTMDKAQYQTGFNDCTTAAIHYLNHTCAVPASVCSRVQNHLVKSGHFRDSDVETRERHRIPQQEPISVHIPSAHAHVPTPVGRVCNTDGNLLIPASCRNNAHYGNINTLSAHARQLCPDSGMEESESLTTYCDHSCNSGPLDGAVWRPW